MTALKITKSAAKFWDGLDAKQYKQVGKAIIGLLNDPKPHDSQVLKGARNDERRVDVGEYRIIYVIAEEKIEVLIIGKRNDDEVYRIWKQGK